MGEFGGVMEVSETEGSKVINEKFVVDDAGDECFILDEFMYYLQGFTTMRGLYFQA